MHREADAELVDRTHNHTEFYVGSRTGDGLEVIEIEACVAGSECIGAAVIDIGSGHALGVV